MVTLSLSHPSHRDGAPERGPSNAPEEEPVSGHVPIPRRPTRRILSGLAAAALLAAWVVLPTTGAQAGLGPDFDVSVSVDPDLSDEALEFQYSYDVTGSDADQVECETDIAIFTEGDPPEELNTTVVVDEVDDTSGAFSLPDLEGGEYELWVRVAVCAIFDEGVQVAETSHGDAVDAIFARLLIDKELEGDVPDDASFTVEVACSQDEGGEGAPVPEAVDRVFDADGGTEVVYFYDEAACTITETEDGGAESTSIEPDEVEIDEAEDLSSTVTNTFPVAEVEDEEEEAEPAEPVEDEPDFTG